MRTPSPRSPSRRSEPSSMRLASWWWVLRPNNSGRILRPRWSGGRPSSRRPTSRSANDHPAPRDRAHRSGGTRSKSRRPDVRADFVRAGVAGAELAEPVRAPDRAVSAGRGSRRDRPHRICPALGDVGPASGDREQGRCQRQHRGRGRRPLGPRRLHHFSRGDFQAVNLFLYPKLSYDPVADFGPVTLVVPFPRAMVVPNSSPSHSVTEFIAYAKTNRGTVRFASPGHGTSPHLAGELFKRAAGIEMTTVPYRGAAPAIQDVIPGRVDVFFNNIAPLL